MRKAIAWFVGMLVAVIPAQSLCQPVDTEVRRPSGKLLYKTKTRGDTTEVRSPSGKLLMKTKQQDGNIEARSPSGKLLYREKSK